MKLYVGLTEQYAREDKYKVLSGGGILDFDFSCPRLRAALASYSTSPAAAPIEGCLRLIEYKLTRGITPAHLVEEINKSGSTSVRRSAAAAAVPPPAAASASKRSSSSPTSQIAYNVIKKELNDLLTSFATASAESEKTKKFFELFRLWPTLVSMAVTTA